MANLDKIEGLKAQHICCECIGEPFLSAQIESTGEQATCTYCGEDKPSWTVERLADTVENAFEEHFRRTLDQPDFIQDIMLRDPDSGYDWYRAGDPVDDAIEEAAQISSEAASHVAAILDNRFAEHGHHGSGEETEFSSDSHYEEKGVDAAEWHEKWRDFEFTLRTEARFFSKSAASLLSSIFGSVDKVKTRSGRGLVVSAGPTGRIKHLYRARVFQTDAKVEEAICRPDHHLGPPPSNLASAGRMNARGIAVFYGATAARTAIAEVRPPVGSKVVVASFEILRPLRLLDLTALEDAVDYGSVFDPSLKPRLERISFLTTVGHRMTRTVMPDDEALEYLATQAVADFLATENEPTFDGIIYRSVQVKSGRNVVLFHKAARVAELDLPSGTELRADSYWDTEDGPEVSYRVTETVPSEQVPEPSREAPVSTYFSTFDVSGEEGWDLRDETLRVDPESVEVHSIDWASFRSTRYEVTRYR